MAILLWLSKGSRRETRKRGAPSLICFLGYLLALGLVWSRSCISLHWISAGNSLRWSCLKVICNSGAFLTRSAYSLTIHIPHPPTTKTKRKRKEMERKEAPCGGVNVGRSKNYSSTTTTAYTYPTLPYPTQPNHTTPTPNKPTPTAAPEIFLFAPSPQSHKGRPS